MTVRREALSNGRVAADGPWVVGESGGEVFATSRRCRHQLADLSQGESTPTAASSAPGIRPAYDIHSGVMVGGPRGFLGYHGPVPGISASIKLLTRLLPLRIGRARAELDGSVSVER